MATRSDDRGAGSGGLQVAAVEFRPYRYAAGLVLSVVVPTPNPTDTDAPVVLQLKAAAADGDSDGAPAVREYVVRSGTARVGALPRTVELARVDGGGLEDDSPGRWVILVAGDDVAMDRLCAAVLGDPHASSRDRRFRADARAITTRPYTRWWWLRGPFTDDAIRYQAAWLAQNGFGGVECAFLDLGGGDRDGLPSWLGEEFRGRIAAAKEIMMNQHGIAVDYTFGTAWPFGGAGVTHDTCARDFAGRSTRQRLHGAWHVLTDDDDDDDDGPPDLMLPLNHLNGDALAEYSRHLLSRGFGAVAGQGTAFFCDSLELDVRGMWDPRLAVEFQRVNGYALTAETFDVTEDPSDWRHPESMVDYRRLRADALCREFYAKFTDVGHSVGSLSRVQCHGAPADLLRCYANCDVPETEALLFPPHFALIAASAAALAGRPVVSCEAFTCPYGFPRGKTMWAAIESHRKERIGDLRLIFDALVANGVNHIVWHGMPFNGGPESANEFYCGVHVGPDSAALAGHLADFNRYMSRVCGLMREGTVFAQVGVLLPNDDAWAFAGRDDTPDRAPASNYLWEHRYTEFPKAVSGYACVWVSPETLGAATVTARSMMIEVPGGNVSPLRAIVVPPMRGICSDTVLWLARLAADGARVVFLGTSLPPLVGTAACDAQVLRRAQEVLAFAALWMPVVVDEEQIAQVVGDRPFLRCCGASPPLPPPFFARRLGPQHYRVFLAHPATRAAVRYPLPLGLAEGAAFTETLRMEVVIQVEACGDSGANDTTRAFVEVAFEGGVTSGALIDVTLSSTAEAATADVWCGKVRGDVRS